MTPRRADRSPQDPPSEDRFGGGWLEFVAARERFFADLAVRSASRIAVPRLPAEDDRQYDRARSGGGEGGRSQ